MKGVQWLCPPKFWSALSKPGQAYCHQLSAGWKECSWKPGALFVPWNFGGVFRPHWKEEQHSPALSFHPPPERLPSSWAQQSSAGILDNLFNGVGRLAGPAHCCPWSQRSYQCPAHLAPCRGKIHLQRVGKACLHCWKKIQLLIATFALLHPVVWLPEFSLLPNPPSHQFPQLWNSLEVTLHFAL